MSTLLKVSVPYSVSILMHTCRSIVMMDFVCSKLCSLALNNVLKVIENIWVVLFLHGLSMGCLWWSGQKTTNSYPVMFFINSGSVILVYCSIHMQPENVNRVIDHYHEHCLYIWPLIFIHNWMFWSCFVDMFLLSGFLTSVILYTVPLVHYLTRLLCSSWFSLVLFLPKQAITLVVVYGLKLHMKYIIGWSTWALITLAAHHQL